MYTMTIDGRPLFDPSVPGYALEDPKLALDANKFGTLTFSIYPNHSEYSNFVLKSNRIKIYHDGMLIFEARPAQLRQNFRGGLDVTCEDTLSRLKDVVWRPRTYHGTGFDPIYTPGQRGEDITDWLLAGYNAAVDPNDNTPWLHINMRDIWVDGYTGEYDFTDKGYTPIWDLLSEITVDECGGYLIPHYTENAGVILDYLDDEHLPTQQQTIELGLNMGDLQIESKASDDFFTVLIPLGADIKNADAELSSNKKLPLTIKSVNDNKIFLTSSAVSTYGWIEKAETWEKIKDASKLKTKGQKFLDKNGGILTTTISITAYDLREAGYDLDYLSWMTRAPVKSPPHNINDYFTVRRMEVMLGSPDATKIEIGNERTTMTDQMQENTRLARDYYLSLSDRVWDLEDVQS